MPNANIRIVVSDELKRGVERIFREHNLTTEEAIRIFLQRSLEARGLPFPMVLPPTWEPPQEKAGKGTPRSPGKEDEP